MSMWKDLGVLKNRKWHILLGVELLLLCAGIFGAMRPAGMAAGKEMTAEMMQEGVSLEPGVYEARIYYETQADGVYRFGVEAEYELPFRGLKSNPVTLFSDRQEAVCQFYLTARCRELKVYLAGEDGKLSGGGDEGFFLQGIEIRRSAAGGRIAVFWILVFSGLLNMAIMVYLYHGRHPFDKMTQVLMAGIFLIVLCASLPLTVDYIVSGEGLSENLTAIERVKDHIAEMISQGNLFLLLPALLRKIGLSMNVSYRLYVLAANAATAVLSYQCIQKCFRDKRAGLLGSVLYTLNPYRLWAVYDRAQLWEYTAMIFLPVFALGVCLLVQKKEAAARTKKGTGFLLAAAGAGGVWMSNLSGKSMQKLLPALGILIGIIIVCALGKYFGAKGRERTVKFCMGVLGALCVLSAVWQTNRILVLGRPLWVYSMSDFESAQERGLSYLIESSYGMKE